MKSVALLSVNNLHPKFPERICWGCDRHCPADDMACGSEVVRGAHPCEIFGPDWLEWSEARQRKPSVHDGLIEAHRADPRQRSETDDLDLGRLIAVPDRLPSE